MLAAEQLRARVNSEHIRQSKNQEQYRRALQQFREDPKFFNSFYRQRSRPSVGTHALLPSTLEIFSPFSTEVDSPISGVLRAKSTSVAIYVDSRDNDTISDSQVSSIFKAFNEVSVPRLHTLWGHESDIDDNGVVLVFLAAPNRIGVNELGFFRPTDLLPNRNNAGVKSNEAEIIYAAAPLEDIPITLTNATLAHETFHLINFSLKSLPTFESSMGTSAVVETLPLNEGEAHLSEDLVGWGVCTAILTQIYLDCLSHTSLFGGGDESVGAKPYCEIVTSGEDSLPRRGGTMLFLLYLFQRLGGAKYSTDVAGKITGEGIHFLKSLITSSASGIDNIEQASGRTFFAWYSDFAATLPLDNTGHHLDAEFNFQDEIKDSFTKQIRNVRLRSRRKDVDGSEINLTGPTDASNEMAKDGKINGTLFATGLNAIHLEIPPNTETTIDVTSSKALELGLTIVNLP